MGNHESRDFNISPCVCGAKMVPPERWVFAQCANCNLAWVTESKPNEHRRRPVSHAMMHVAKASGLINADAAEIALLELRPQGDASEASPLDDPEGERDFDSQPCICGMNRSIPSHHERLRCECGREWKGTEHGTWALQVKEDSSTDRYARLKAVFADAADQASAGKGAERHDPNAENYEDQQIVQLCEWMGSNHGDIFQACKKAIESANLPHDRARAELLGAINYLAAAVIVLDRAEARAEVRAELEPAGHVMIIEARGWCPKCAMPRNAKIGERCPYHANLILVKTPA